MGDTTERVRVIFEAFTNRMKRGFQQAEDMVNNFRTNFRGFNAVLGQNHKQWSQAVAPLDNYNVAGVKVGNTLKNFTQGLKGFRMEALGVMFFGQMLSKTMFGLLRPAGEAMGIFDIFGLVLQTVFLPILELLLPAFLFIAEAFMNSPKWVKILLGGLVLILGIVGLVIGIFGAFTLAIGSIAAFFGVTVGVVVAFIAGIVGAIVVVVAFIIALFSFKKIGAFLKMVFSSILNVFLKLPGRLFKMMKDLISGIKDKLGKLKDLFIEKFGDIVGKAKDFGSKIIKGIVKGIKNMGSAIWEAIKKGMGAAGSFAGKVLGTIGGAIGLGGDGGGSSTINVVNNNNVNVADKTEMQRLIDENNKIMVDKINTRSTG